MRVNLPAPVTSTVEVLTVPSTNSTFAALLITTSFVFAIVTSVILISPVPEVSIPIAFEAIETLLKATSASVFGPYLNAAPALLITVPERAPVRSLA